jgi:hypothetical protein
MASPELTPDQEKEPTPYAETGSKFEVSEMSVLSALCQSYVAETHSIVKAESHREPE